MEALLMKVPEAAALLGVSRAKLYELIASGALTFLRPDPSVGPALFGAVRSDR